MNNTIGGMIGFGLFAICYVVYLLFRKNASERIWSVGRVIAYQLPLIFICVSYLAVFAVYDHQELGNMMSQNTVHFKKGSLQVSSEENYSEQEAYEQITKGKFYVWLEDADSYEIEVGKGTLSYEKDAKGFYQPTYLFSATVNGAKSEIAIPAIKK